MVKALAKWPETDDIGKLKTRNYDEEVYGCSRKDTGCQDVHITYFVLQNIHGR